MYNGEREMSNNTSGNGRGDGHIGHMVVKYKECLKNHAAAIGGNATDGCGEFIPSGEEGSIEALKCSACNCHRNFHRKDIECDCSTFNCCHLINGGRKIVLGPHHGYVSPAAAAPQPIVMSYKGGSIPSETDEKDYVRVATKGKKRFRTKFSQAQKEKMFGFAEKAGWRIQKLDENDVQQFCQDIGIKRRVLKVWMHNNKQSFAKKHNVSAAAPSGVAPPPPPCAGSRWTEDKINQLRDAVAIYKCKRRMIKLPLCFGNSHRSANSLEKMEGIYFGRSLSNDESNNDADADDVGGGDVVPDAIAAFVPDATVLDATSSTI